MDPATLKYTRTHEWLHLDAETATIGVTDFAVRALSDLVFIDLPAVGRRLVAGEPFGEVESVKAVSDLYAPLAGEVIAVNAALVDDLDLLAADPFGRGWMMRLKLADPSAVDTLLDRAGYEAHCATESH